jgi:hypothetical protein
MGEFVRIFIALLFFVFSGFIFAAGKPDHIYKSSFISDSYSYGRQLYYASADDTFKSESVQFMNKFDASYSRNTSEALFSEHYSFSEFMNLNAGSNIFSAFVSSSFADKKSFGRGFEYFTAFQRKSVYDESIWFEFGLFCTNQLDYGDRYKEIPFICPIGSVNYKSDSFFIRIGVPLIITYFNGKFMAGFRYAPILNGGMFARYSFLPFIFAEAFSFAKVDKIASSKFSDDDDELHLFGISSGLKAGIYISRNASIVLEGGYTCTRREWISDSSRDVIDAERKKGSWFSGISLSAMM